MRNTKINIYSNSLMYEGYLNLMTLRRTRGLSPLSILNPRENRYSYMKRFFNRSL